MSGKHETIRAVGGKPVLLWFDGPQGSEKPRQYRIMDTSGEALAEGCLAYDEALRLASTLSRQASGFCDRDSDGFARARKAAWAIGDALAGLDRRTRERILRWAWKVYAYQDAPASDLDAQEPGR